MSIREEAERFCSQKLRAFRDDAGILHLASVMLRLRESIKDDKESAGKRAWRISFYGRRISI